MNIKIFQQKPQNDVFFIFKNRTFCILSKKCAFEMKMLHFFLKDKKIVEIFVNKWEKYGNFSLNMKNKKFNKKNFKFYRKSKELKKMYTFYIKYNLFL